MKIGIIGTRGIPNNYGGFEQLAEYLSLGLVEKGHDVVVYNSHNHKYTQSTWRGVNIVHCFDPERNIGTVGQFIYDLNCILDSRKRGFDAIINLGYTSSAIWMGLFARKAKVITNMDGMEWKRSKYSAKVQAFLKFSEKRAVKHSYKLVADSLAIKDYLEKEYRADVTFIAYGSDLFSEGDAHALLPYKITPFGYSLLIARMEPENNIEMILDGLCASETKQPFLVTGNIKNKFGRYLAHKFEKEERIVFTGPVYQPSIINNLRFYSNLYFHGHSVGGTHPSLLEAMGCKALVAAHNNVFNKSVLGPDAYYFSSAGDVKLILDGAGRSGKEASLYIERNFRKIAEEYTWKKIIDSYEELVKL